MTTSLCKQILLFLLGSLFLVTGCTSTGKLETGITRLEWAGNGQEEIQSPPVKWAGEGKIEGGIQANWAGPRVAVLPVHNMTLVPAPLETLETLISDGLKNRGVFVLDRKVLEQFMENRRMRYTGGVNRTIARAIKDELGVEAVFITSLVNFDEADPPKISLIARLVDLEQDLQILWMDSYCKVGDDTPGFLDLGLIDDPHELMKKATDQLAGSMILRLAGNIKWREKKDSGRSRRPTDIFRSPGFESGDPVTIAVMPFLNLSERSYAWEILPLHFVQRLVDMPGIRVLEPGEVRQDLLKYRVFLQGGVSRPNLELVLKSTEADLVLTGTVMRYVETKGLHKDPEVDFSIEIYDRASEEVVWSSGSSGKGRDGVFFFGLGSKSSACSLAEAMVSATVSEMPLKGGDMENKKDNERVIH